MVSVCLSLIPLTNLRLRLKLVDVAACIALTFFPQTITESSVKDWLTARAVVYDNILLGAIQVQSMEPSRKLGIVITPGS